jgi:hypothetical protein
MKTTDLHILFYFGLIVKPRYVNVMEACINIIIIIVIYYHHRLWPIC